MALIIESKPISIGIIINLCQTLLKKQYQVLEANAHYTGNFNIFTDLQRSTEIGQIRVIKTIILSAVIINGYKNKLRCYVDDIAVT